MVRAVPTLVGALLCALSLLLSPLFASPVLAHGKSLSYSAWHLDEDGAQVSVRIPLLELSRLGIPLPLPGEGSSSPDGQEVGEYLTQHLKLITPDGPCTRTAPPTSRPTETGWVRFRWSLRCPAGNQRTLQSRILLNEAPSHLHFARLTLESESESARPRIVERVLTVGGPSWKLNLAPPGAESESPSASLSGTSFMSYGRLGVEHILSGWDHLAFVLALILLARNLGEVARLITGFTVAHSLTLALAVLGWVRAEAAPIEALIGFSVALIALENGWSLGGRGREIPRVAVLGLLVMAGLAAAGFGSLAVLTLLGLAVFMASHFELLRRSPDTGLHRVALAFAFGLVHGFGFAGILAEMQLPSDRLASALLGFNLGVEVGQLAVVALIWPLLALLRRTASGAPHRLFAEIASGAVFATGLYWFLIRTLGSG